MCDHGVGIGWELGDWDYRYISCNCGDDGGCEKGEVVDLVEVLRLFAWLLC